MFGSSEERVIDVLRISGDGTRIVVYHPGKQGKSSTGKIVNWKMSTFKMVTDKIFNWLIVTQQSLPGKMVTWKLCHMA